MASYRIDVALLHFSPQVLRENEMLRRDVEVKESKLSSSMNSIKTFWSPELKKERALRKDEVSKITVWKEQYRVIQDEAQVSHTFNILDIHCSCGAAFVLRFFSLQVRGSPILCSNILMVNRRERL